MLYVYSCMLREHSRGYLHADSVLLVTNFTQVQYNIVSEKNNNLNANYTIVYIIGTRYTARFFFFNIIKLHYKLFDRYPEQCIRD